MYHTPYRATARVRTGQHRQWPRVAYQERLAYQVPAPMVPIVQAGGTYLGEDETYYYYMHPQAGNELNGFFDGIGNMFSRMVKFTPKSFTPGNIYKGFVNTTLTVASGGLYQALPKNLKKTVYEVGKVAIPVVAGGVLAVAAGPAVMATLMPKLTAAAGLLSKGAGAVGSMFGGGGGGAATNPDASQMPDPRYNPPIPGGPSLADKAITIGGALMGFLSKLPQNKQAEVIQQVTPEDIAYMEQYQAIPPRLQPYFDSVAQSTFNPPIPSSGAAELYGPPAPVQQASMAGGMAGLDLQTILLFAVPAVFFLLSNRSGK